MVLSDAHDKPVINVTANRIIRMMYLLVIELGPFFLMKEHFIYCTVRLKAFYILPRLSMSRR